jgi:serine/threonine-protein kinase
LDFGISKDTNLERPDLEMTGAKDLIGSPLYMSPEQMRSARKVDARADVWALGAILYKLITGRAPFHAPTVPEIFALTLGKHARPPSALRPEISSDLNAVIVRCLDKQLQNRYPSAAELGAALLPHGPWEPTAAESANQLFLPAPRRTSIPPEPPRTNFVEEMPPRDALLPAAIPSVQCMEGNEPMMGLARSNRLVRSAPISSWSGSRTRMPLRPGWLAFVVVLSIFSSFVGAGIVAFFAGTKNISFANRPQEMSNANELRMPPADIAPIPTPVPTPAATPKVIVVEASANVVTKVPPSPSSVPRVFGELQGSKRARVLPSFDPKPRPLTSAETKAQVRVPAKPETSLHVPVDPFPRRD